MTHNFLLSQLLLLSLILSSGAFTTTTTTRPGRISPTTTGFGRNQGRLTRQHSGRPECPSVLRLKRASGAVDRNLFECRGSLSSPSSFLLRSAASDEDGGDEAEAVEAAATTTSDDDVAAIDPKWKRTLFWYKYNKDGTPKPDEDEGLTFKQKLAKAGLSVLLSYGFVSNMSYCVTVSLAWFGFSKKTGLSPLAPGQWKGFLAVYAGFYVFNNFIRPMRFAASVGVAPYFDRIVKSIQRRTKLGKAASIGIVVFLANIVGTTSLMSLGIYIASLAAGIPVFPPKA